MVNNYTYSFDVMRKVGKRWRCSVHNRGCKAYIITNEDDAITAIIGTHVHDPQNYMKLPTGNYIKI